MSLFRAMIIITVLSLGYLSRSNKIFYPRFEGVEGIVHIQGVATKVGVIRTESDFEGIILKGVGEDYNWSYFEEYLVEGRLPNFVDKLNQEILISEYIASRLGFKIGDKAITYFLKRNATTNSRPNIRALEIVGIYNSGFQDFDESYLFADIRHIQRMNKWEDDQVGNFEVFIEDFDEINIKGKEIFDNIPSTLDAQTIAMKYGTIFEWLKLFDLNIIGIIAIIILVAGINMITALLVLILERTPMIGILKALGSADWSIRKTFLYNAGYLILLGLFWGNVIGIGLLFIQQNYGVYLFKSFNLLCEHSSGVYRCWLYPSSQSRNITSLYVDAFNTVLCNF